jgi:hypothetical protein
MQKILFSHAKILSSHAVISKPQKICEIDQTGRMLWLVEFEKSRKQVACVHSLNLN